MKDLIRGSIFAECDEMKEAYQYFKRTPGVKIVHMKTLEKMKDLSNVTVLFVFENKFVGEMQMRFKTKDPWYEANHFLYEIHRSQMKIELLQTLYRTAIKLSQRGQLYHFYQLLGGEKKKTQEKFGKIIKEDQNTSINNTKYPNYSINLLLWLLLL